MQVEGVKALTGTYKQIQESFAEQITIYLQAAWRRYAARKQSKIANVQRKPTRTSSFNKEFLTGDTVTDADMPDG